MKKNKKLVLNKETVRNLDGAVLSQIAGGSPPTTASRVCCCADPDSGC